MLYGMTKVLACCEHCISNDKTGKFNEILQHLPHEFIVRVMVCNRGGYLALRESKKYTPWKTEDFRKHNL